MLFILYVRRAVVTICSIIIEGKNVTQNSSRSSNVFLHVYGIKSMSRGHNRLFLISTIEIQTVL